MRPFGDHLLDEEPAACVPLPHFWQPQRNDIPAIGAGIAETQNRQINLIKPSSMFARRAAIGQAAQMSVARRAVAPMRRSSHDHDDASARSAQNRPALDHLKQREHAARGALRCHKPNRKDRAMKLNATQLERTMNQFEAQALPDNHPAVPELSNLFGDHTFLLDSNGLNILEPAEETPQRGVQAARVINLANWSDENLNKLSPHEPEPTGAIVELPVSRH
jgi:hypothetical protein